MTPVSAGSHDGRVRGDGNGWTQCLQGHRHWGLHGAAGLLLRRVDDKGIGQVLMQHRAPWTAHGDTWGLPGGARDSHESAVQAALREAHEETGIPAELVRPVDQLHDEHGGWSYVTVVAEVLGPVTLRGNRESLALQWVAESRVEDLELHPGFAGTWPVLRSRW